MRLLRRMATVAGLVAAAMALAAASASATLWVGTAPTVEGEGSGCTKPGYNSIQKAIEAATEGASIHVCSGTYTEQLQIEQAVKIEGIGPVTVKLPAEPANSTTACDTALGTEPYPPDQDLVAICGTGTVQIKGLTLEAIWPEGTCSESMYGILVAGGANLKLTGANVIGAGPRPINGCQGGVGIQIGMGWTEPVEVGMATLSNVSVTEYQKNGITVDGAQSKATIKSTTVKGAGETPEIAQNGIQVSFGAKASIASSVISGNECNNASCGADSLAYYQSTGVLLYGAAGGTKVSKSTISNNDIGVYYESDSPTAPSSPKASITSDSLLNDRYESVLLSQGFATVNSNLINGGNVAIQLLQYNGQLYGPKGTGKGDQIENMADWAIQGYSDENPADFPGSFSITASHISGNPAGASVSNSITSNAPNLKITTAPTDT